MRRFFDGLAVLAIAVLGPAGLHADDRQIAQEIVKGLQEQERYGALEDYSIDLQVKDGDVRLKGYVASSEQSQLALGVAEQVDGVTRVRNELDIRPAENQEGAAGRVQAEGRLSSWQHGLLKLVAFNKDDAQDEDESRAVAEEIIRQLRAEMQKGKLRGFGIEVHVENGVVSLNGRVSNAEQRDLALKVARGVEGVRKVVDKLQLKSPSVGESLAPEEVLEATERDQPELLQSASSAENPTADADSEELAREVVRRLRKQKDLGNLTNFAVDVRMDGANVWLSGRVANEQQLQLVLDQARYVPGVKAVVNDLTTQSSTQLASAIDDRPPLANYTAAPPAAFAAPPSGQAALPMAFATARPTNYQAPSGQPVTAAPMPMQAPGVGIAPARYDHPTMPGYAWPSYAAYPNYGAVTYPRQYAASAWPYIGPFYPYPQVPLGWRKVTLEWDDGWWYLDFKNHHN